MSRSPKQAAPPRRLSVAEQFCTVQLDVKDLQRLAESLIGIPFSFRRGSDGTLALTLTGLDVSRLVPDFDLTVLITAALRDPQTIRFSVDMTGVAGWVMKAFQVVGGLPWMVGNFAAHAAFTVDNAGHVDLHLDRLPGDVAEWLTNRLELRSCSIPGAGRSAATATFTIKRFMSVA
jgi:hypothetical protein